MAVVLPSPSSPSLRPMTTSTSILLRPSSSPSSSPSPASTPLPALQADLSSSSSSSASGSCFDLYRTSSAPSTRRIRFAPLPDPQRDVLPAPNDPSLQYPQPDTKPATDPLPSPDNLGDGLVALSPSVSSDSTHSSARSTPTIRTSPNTPSKNATKPNLKLFRPFTFFRRANSSPLNRSPLSQSASLPASRNSSPSSLNPSSSSVPSSPALRSAMLPRFSPEDILPLGGKSFFRTRSGSSTSSRPSRPSSPPPKPSGKSLHRSVSTGSGLGRKLGTGKHDLGEGPSQSHDSISIAGSGAKKRRASSSTWSPGAGGGRHATSVKMAPNPLPARPSTAPSSYHAAPKKQVKMLNGRVYGARRYAAQTLANPFANVREEPEFVEWGYGGMGSVQASAGIANDMWKGLQRSERGGALFAGPSTAPVATPGDGSGSRAHTASPTARRKMSTDVPECGMGNVGAGVPDEDDGSGMGWVKRRRAEREAKTRLEQEARQKTQEKRKSSDSIDADMYASTASTATSLTACTSTASTDLTTPATTPLTSRSPSVTDLALTSPLSLEFQDLRAAPPCALPGQQSSAPDTSAHPVSMSKDEHERHVLMAVRLSPSILSSSHKHGHSASLPRSLSSIDKGVDTRDIDQVAPLSPVETRSTNSSDENAEELSRSSDEEEEQDDGNDDKEDEAQDIRRKTAVGAGVEKISRHVDVEAR